MATVSAQGPLWVDNTLIADIVEAQTEQAERRRPRRFLDRVPLVPAEDEEITAVWTANRFAADIIAPNQKARVVSAGRMEFNIAELPNVKLGARLNQQDINRIERIQERQMAGTAGADSAFLFWDAIVRERREGVLDRLNALAAAMLIGNLSYDRLGVQIVNTFLMPADLKMLAPVGWASTAALPITDIQNAMRYCDVTYGWVPNRVTMTRADFTNMVATDQVKNLSQRFIGIAATAAVNTADWKLMQNYIGQLIDMAIEIDDHTFRTEENDGTPVVHRDLPVGTVLLTNSADDGDRMMFDMANAPLTEAVVARLTGMDVDLGGQTRGPAVYATAPHELNPPEVTVWAVSRTFPRRKQYACSATLTV